MRYHQVVAVSVLLTLFSVQPTHVDADANDRPADGFRTELWRMEFRKQEKEKEKNKDGEEEQEDGQNKAVDPDAVQLEDIEPQVGGNRSLTSRGPLRVESAVENDQIAQDSVPGETDLADLRTQTPFADWQVDESAERPTKAFHGHANAWTISKSGSTRSALPEEEPMSEGPSAITLLVAIVACIVMVGAFFSGRE